MKNTTTRKKLNRQIPKTSMHAEEFCALVGKTPANELAEYFEVDARQIRRYKSGETVIPGAVARLTRLRFGDNNAEVVLGKEWDGFRFGADGNLYVPGWRGGFDPHGIKAMFFRVQLVGGHEATIKALEKRVHELEQDVIQANIAAAKYRGLVSREAKFGLMLERIVAD